MEFKYWLLLQEVHFTDTYASGFLEFRKKYSKLKNDKTLFVNFSNYSKDILEKTPYANPSHSDPIGIYAYPLWYVIDYPADIWYASNASYLRVIKMTSGKVLYLQNMDLSYAKSLLRKLNIPDEYLKLSQKTFKGVKGAGQIGKQFFQAIQHDLSKEIPKTESDYEASKKYYLRSGSEQTDLLQKLGIDVLIDDARNANQAVINDREPSQAIFLNKNAFQILEVFNLKQQPKDGYISTARSSLYDDKLARKLASKILENLNDQIVEKSEFHNKSSNQQIYYTKLGRMIKITFSLPDFYYKTRKMGEKKHKESKTYDLWEILVELYGERETTILKYDSSKKFDSIAKDFANNYNKKTILTDFKPYSFKRSKEEKEIQEKEYFQKEIEKKNKEEERSEVELQPLMQELLNILGINLKLSTDKKWYKQLQTFHNLGFGKDKTSDEIIKDAWEIYNAMSDRKKSISNDEMFLSPEDTESMRFIQMYKKILDFPNSEARIFKYISSNLLKSAIDYYKQD